MTYDRNARRLADNQHGNTPTGDYTPGDDIAAAVYPDPKARHLYGETETLQSKRATRAADDAANEAAVDEPAPKPKTAKK